MQIQTADYRSADLQKLISSLRVSLTGIKDVVSEASLEKTVKAFGKPLSVQEVVRTIIRDVRLEGDKAVARYTQKLDSLTIPPENFRVSTEDITASLDKVPEPLVQSMRLSYDRIRRFQMSLLTSPPEAVSCQGCSAQIRSRPLKRVGAYVPGGAAVYPSSVLMTVVPAQVAGVPQIVMCSPAGRRGSVEPPVLAAAAIAGIEEVYCIGGVQAVAAMALGTETISRVDKVVGPGNMFVTEAKRQLFGEVGIDLLAGPSEVLIIADHTAPPEFIAADMISQAEHDPGCAVLLTTHSELLSRVERELTHRLDELPRRDAALASLEKHGMMCATRDIDQAAALADEFGPEHLEIMTEAPDQVAEKVLNAGAIFLGMYTPEATGDYLAGPSHVLPTGGAARFMSGLSARDFLKVTSIVSYSPQALESVAEDIVRIAESEGLSGHAASVLVRFEAHRRR